MERRPLTLPASPTVILARLAWIVIIAMVLVGLGHLVAFLFSLVDPPHVDELWYLAWM